MINAAHAGPSARQPNITGVTAESRSMAADRVTLLTAIARWERRRRLVASAIVAPRGLIIGSLAAAVLAVIARLRPLLLPAQLMLLAAGFMIGGALFAMALIWLWPRSVTASARIFDRRFAASERLSTALELADPAGMTPGQFAMLQVRDARRYAEALDVRHALPIDLKRREWAGALIAIVIVALLIFLPNSQTALITSQQAVQASIAQQIGGLQRIAQDVQKNPALTDAQKAAIEKTAQAAIAQLSQPGITAAEASAILSDAAQKFQNTPAQVNSSAQSAQQSAGKALTNGSQTSSPQLAPGMSQIGKALQQGNLSQAATAAQSLSQTLGQSPNTSPNGQPTPSGAAASVNSTPGASSGGTPSASGTASVSSGAADPAAAKAFADAASALQNTDPTTAKAFQQAAQALQNGDTASAQKALDQAGKSLQATQDQQNQSPLSQAANQAAQQTNQGAQQIAKSGDQSSPDNTPGQPPSGQSPSNGAQNGSQGQNSSQAGQPNNGSSSSSSSPSNDPNGSSQPGQGTPGGSPSGKTGGTQLGSGTTDANSPQLIGQNGQPVNQSGPGSGSPGSASAGQGAGGAGNNVTSGTGSSNPTGGTINTNNGHGDGSLATPEQVYAPVFAAASAPNGGTLAIPNAPNTDPNAPPNNPQVVPLGTASANVPLSSVIGSAVTQSNQAMDDAHVPISLRGVIHDYFSGLQNTTSQPSGQASPAPAATAAP